MFNFSVASSVTSVWTVVIVSTRFGNVSKLLTDEDDIRLNIVSSVFLFAFVFVCVYVVLGN